MTVTESKVKTLYLKYFDFLSEGLHVSVAGSDLFIFMFPATLALNSMDGKYFYTLGMEY